MLPDNISLSGSSTIFPALTAAGVWQSGLLHQTVNLAGLALRWFKSIRPHHILKVDVKGTKRSKKQYKLPILFIIS